MSVGACCLASRDDFSSMRVLMVLTSHDKLGDTGKKTGFWLEEFAAPYFTFLDAGADVTVASPRGGSPPLDPKSDAPEGQTEATKRFKETPEAQAVLAHSIKLKTAKAEDTMPCSMPVVTDHSGTWH